MVRSCMYLACVTMLAPPGEPTWPGKPGDAAAPSLRRADLGPPSSLNMLVSSSISACSFCSAVCGSDEPNSPNGLLHHGLEASLPSVHPPGGSPL
eukprot:5298832-Prymnesium_polylepis.1